MNKMVISAEGLTKTFPDNRVRVLDGLDLEVSRGESLAIVGPSGSGKSTLLQVLNGLTRPDCGRLEMFGTDTRNLGEPEWSAWRRARIATVFQDTNLIPTLSVERNIAFRASLASRPDPARCRRLMEALGIAAVAGRYPDRISGGERQRAAIAATFAMRPELLLADEPTGSLDEQTAQRVTKLLFEAIHEHNLTAVVVTHNLGLARHCDRTLLLTGGVLGPTQTAPAASA